MRADPTLTADTAGVLLDAASAFADLAGAAASTLDIDGAAFGDLPAVAGLAGAYRAGADAVGGLIEQIVEVLEGDADRLYRIAFGVQAADQAAAGRMAGVAVGRMAGLALGHESPGGAAEPGR